MDEKELVEKAHRWFAITYGKTAEQLGYHCVKIWYKPIMGYNLRINKYAEVVFGPSEKEVNSFIKEQTFIRRGVNFGVILILFNGLGLMGMMYTMVINNLDALKVVMITFCCMDFITSIAFCCFSRYLKPLEKIYRGKIATYMDK